MVWSSQPRGCRRLLLLIPAASTALHLGGGTHEDAALARRARLVPDVAGGWRDDRRHGLGEGGGGQLAGREWRAWREGCGCRLDSVAEASCFRDGGRRGVSWRNGMRWTIDGEQAYLLSRGAREGEMVVLWELLGRQASGASWRGAMEATRPRGDDAGAAAARQGTCQLKASSSRGGRPSTAGWEADLREVRGGGGGVVLREGGQGEGQGRGGGGGTGREAGPGERPRARVVERFCPRTTAAAGAKRPSRAKRAATGRSSSNAWAFLEEPRSQRQRGTESYGRAAGQDGGAQQDGVGADGQEGRGRSRRAQAAQPVPSTSSMSSAGPMPLAPSSALSPPCLRTLSSAWTPSQPSLRLKRGRR